MSMTFDKVCALVQRGEVRVSDHGYDEMSDEDILARDVLAGVFDGVVVEDYPMYAKGPCVLVLQIDLIPICGLKISRGEKHEKEAAYKTGP